MKAILVLMDSLNREYLKPYNQDAWTITPNINAFSDDCIKFNKHYVGSAPCMPARRDLMTGRLNFLERNWGPMEVFDDCFTSILREHKKYTHIITDHDHYFERGGENYVQGFDSWAFIRGQELDPWVADVKPAPIPEKHYGMIFPEYEKNKTRFTTDNTFPTPVCFQHAIEWLRDNKSADDFFLQVEVFSPHEPFNAPQEFLDLYHDDYNGPPFVSSAYKKVTEPPEAVEHLKKRYAAGLTMTDKWFGTFIEAVKETGRWDDTLIILTTDHGHLLGEHGYTGKNFMHQYNRISNIPMFVHLPGSESAGKQVDEITQNIDLMPTLLEYFGATIPERVKGQSILPILKAQPHENRGFALYGTFGGPATIFDGKYTYHRAPADESNSPLYYYTSMPVTLFRYLGVDCADEIEMGRYLKHTNYPVYKIPAGFPIMQLKSTEPFKDTMLFDWENDWPQENPLNCEGIEKDMIEKLKKALIWADSPDEQFERLGLNR